MSTTTSANLIAAARATEALDGAQRAAMSPSDVAGQQADAWRAAGQLELAGVYDELARLLADYDAPTVCWLLSHADRPDDEF